MVFVRRNGVSVIGHTWRVAFKAEVDFSEAGLNIVLTRWDAFSPCGYRRTPITFALKSSGLQIDRYHDRVNKTILALIVIIVGINKHNHDGVSVLRW
jgi:hypothetical protein